jgi:two-component system OmpR family response regulator
MPTHARVMFVDDEEELVSAVVERLNLRDLVAHGCTSGIDALKRIDSEEYNVVVLDVRMPGIGGIEVLRLLKQQHPATQVILLSGHGSLEDVERGLGYGAFDYLQKPVEIDHLIEVILQAAGAHEREEPHTGQDG